MAESQPIQVCRREVDPQTLTNKKIRQRAIEYKISEKKRKESNRTRQSVSATFEVCWEANGFISQENILTQHQSLQATSSVGDSQGQGSFQKRKTGRQECYRPLSMLSFPSKLMQSCVASNIFDDAGTQDLLDDRPWAYKKGKSEQRENGY